LPILPKSIEKKNNHKIYWDSYCVWRVSIFYRIRLWRYFRLQIRDRKSNVLQKNVWTMSWRGIWLKYKIKSRKRFQSSYFKRFKIQHAKRSTALSSTYFKYSRASCHIKVSIINRMYWRITYSRKSHNKIKLKKKRTLSINLWSIPWDYFKL
jgi:hypothetical protein